MSFSRVHSAQPVFLTSQPVTIEIDLARGLHALTIVGLPDKAVEESKDRVCAAIKNSGFTSPKSRNQKVVVSLAPAEHKKEGPIFDLGIALAYLLATKDIAFNPDKKLFIGELSLDGSVQPVRGVLAIAHYAKDAGFTELFLPKQNAREAALVSGITIYGVATLHEVIAHLNTKAERQAPLSKQPQTEVPLTPPTYAINFDDIRGQETAKRGLEIAAAGRHNIVLYGPPGTGKTMLAKAFCTILPPLLFEEALEVTSIHSIAGTLDEPLVTHPPLRAPHHTASYVSLVGGGTFPKPGEVTLAHHGVLFLDEFPEFDRRCIDALRQPLEDHVVHVTRARGSVTFPARFILVAAMNPLPTGESGHGVDAYQQGRLQKKISGPIVDRIDMWIEVPHIDHKKLSEKPGSMGETERIKKRVSDAREMQRRRFIHSRATTNSDMSVRDLDTYITLDTETKELLNRSSEKLHLSPRAYHRMIKLARTIADLEQNSVIESRHILEAFQYRPRIFG